MGTRIPSRKPLLNQVETSLPLADLFSGAFEFIEENIYPVHKNDIIAAMSDSHRAGLQERHAVVAD